MLVEAGDPRWRLALRRVAHSAHHLPAHACLDADLTGGRPVAFLYDDGADLLLLPLVLREVPHARATDAASPYGYPGPVATTADPVFWRRALVRLLEVLRDAGVVSCFVRTSPVLPAPAEVLEEAGTLVHHGQTVRLDLRGCEEARFETYRTNHRRDIRRARSAGHRVVVDAWDLLPEYVDVYRETMSRVGAAPAFAFPDWYFRRLRDDFAEAAHLVLVLCDEELLGGGLFLEAGPVLEYHLGGARTAALPLQPAKTMVDGVARWASARPGLEQLHLGGGTGRTDDGLFRFKAGFSGDRGEVHTLRLVPDEGAYAALLPPGAPDDRTGFFPAYRRP